MLDNGVLPRRRISWILVAAVSGLPLLWFAWAWLTYPSDRTPEGAYLRVMSAINRDRPEEFFAYLETAAQHAAYTIRDYRRKSRELVLADYPEPERQRLAQAYAVHANAPDGADVFAAFAKERGWVERLRRDMSGIDHVDQQGDRATVQTVRGTRYPFRRRENGIWGLTIFTAELVSEAEKAARDHSVIEKSAADYRRARASR
ncbi:MAG TPA: hypothetical protein VKZ49_16670 [Polyangiaceae bacterium]|nr:hypothetical protein [Polyangiaceae bacterium]